MALTALLLEATPASLAQVAPPVDASKGDSVTGVEAPPVAALNSFRLRRANSAETGGDAIRSLATYQEAYDEALKGVRSTARATLAPGNEEHVVFVRQAAEAGYYLAWARFDQRNVAVGNAIVEQLTKLLAPYDGAIPQPRWRLPVARLLWLRGNSLREAGHADEAAQMEERVLALTADREAYLPDYLALSRLRISALWTHGDWGPKRDAFRLEACKVADELDSQVSGSMNFRKLECIIDKARQQAAAGHNSEALVTLDGVNAVLRLAQTSGKMDQALRMREVQAKLQEADLYPDAPQAQKHAVAKLAAARLFIKALNMGAYLPNSAGEPSTIYNALRDEDFSAIPAYALKEDQIKLKLDLFSAIAQAVEPSRKVFPQSIYWGTIGGSANGIAAQALIDLKQPEPALAYAARAVAVVEETRLIEGVTDFTEDGMVACTAYQAKANAELALGRIDAATATYRALQTTCGGWLRQYPWDFYARQGLTGVAWKLGVALADAGRGAEARAPLRFASDWGSKEASETLAKLLGTSTAPADLAEARKRAAQAAQQSLKRFTVPTDFAGVKYPFNVYVSQYGEGKRCPADRALKPDEEGCVGFTGINDQAQWVTIARGGKVPKDAIDAFEKLDKLARENNVSFPDLCVYALAAKKGKEVFGATEANVAALAEQMRAAQFHRNPLRQLDNAGIALGGFDAVSYRQGDKPVAGKVDQAAIWDHAVWLFASAGNRATFLKEPERYAPRYGGFAAMEMAEGKVSRGDPEIFAITGDRLTLFDGTDEAASWKAAPAGFIAKADAAWADAASDSEPLETELGDMIVKHYQVEALGYRELFVERCQGGNALACDIVNQALCAKHNLEACDRHVAFAEQGGDKRKLGEALSNRSYVRVLAHLPEQALADSDRALALVPDVGFFLGNRADALLTLGRTGPALAIYRTLTTAPKDGTPEKFCKALAGDLDEMVKAKVIGDSVARQVRRAIPCTVAAPPPQ